MNPRLLVLPALVSLLGATTPDLRHTFFSRKGSWMTLIPTNKPGTLRLYFARQKEEEGHWLDLAFQLDGKPRALALTAHPSHLALNAGGTAAPKAKIYVAGPREVVVDAEGLGLAVHSVKKGLDLAALKPIGPNAWEAPCGDWTLRIERLAGSDLLPTAQFLPMTGRLRLTFRIYRGVRPASLKVDPAKDLAAIDTDWQLWKHRMPAVAPERQALAEAAWWNLWSLHTPTDVQFPTETVLVAKADMNGVWPWDHCFVTLGLGLTDLQGAWNQFLIPFLNADANGQLPDQMLPEDTYRGCTKPPIHGWTLQRLMARHAIPRPWLEDFYPRLTAWTEFWFRHRMTPSGLPAYGGEHSGWESGWDNATVLGDKKARYIAPDLQAYLVLQMEALSQVAQRLGKIEEAHVWRTRADEHQARMMAQLWNGHSFVVRAMDGPEPDPEPSSLLPLMPLILGERLDKAVFAALAARLEACFLTPVGPATEDPLSPAYRPDGYWRGPVWAPTTLILADGLRRGGRPDLAKEIARRFSDTVQRAGGHYENYDSLSGAPLRCKGFAWTSAVDLVFMHDYLR